MITLDTNKPVAVDSHDHTSPAGTGYDNSTWQPFNDKLFSLIPKPRLLDLGCAGGGLVRSIIEDGGFAVGVEGSDLSLKTGRAEWPAIPDSLFTADCTEPFTLLDKGDPLLFDIVTAWEFFEHIWEHDLRGVIRNIRAHLVPDGILAVSISERESWWHVNVKPARWWRQFFGAEGFVEDGALRDFFEPDWVRGEINGTGGSFCTTFRWVG